MYLSVNKLLNAKDDQDFYRLFFIVVCILNIVFHYLFLNFVPASFDPLLLRLFCSAFFLLTFFVSYFDQKSIYYRVNVYFATIFFLGVNNCYLLGENNFIGEYFFGSVVTLLVVSFFCRRYYEMLILLCINLAAFTAGIFFANTYVELPPLILTEVLVSALACFLFLLRKSYILRFEDAMRQMADVKRNLEQTNQLLAFSNDRLTCLKAANPNIVFECDLETRTIVSKWHQENSILDKRTPKLVGGSINDLQITGLDHHLDILVQTQVPVNFEFDSFLGDSFKYSAVINPVFDDMGQLASRCVLVLNNITAIKNTELALKESELILFNEQIIAKMGSWWMDVSGKDISWSNNLFSILEVGFIPPDKSKLQFYVSLIHPEDRDDAQHYFATLANNPLNEFEHRLITPQGKLKYFKVICGQPIKDDRGNVLKFAGIIQDITALKLAEKLIRKSQIELSEVQAIAKIGGWNWDVTLNSLNWSDEIYRIYELDKDEVKDADHFKLLLAFVHPDDKELVAATFRDHLKLSRSFVEYRMITSSGKLKYISIIIGKTIKKDGVIKKVIGTLQDLTERKKIEFDYERSENKYKNVLTTIDLAAVTLNKDGIVVFCNKHLADITGYDKIEMVGMNWIDSFVPDYLKEQFTSWLQSNSFYPQHTSPIICRNGKQRIINWKNTVTYDEFGQIAETTSIGDDITEIKKAREALIIAKENAEKSSRFKSEFLSIMSHEIRTPMNAVIGTTNLLLQDNPEPRQMEYLNTLQYSSNNLLELINDILDYNKIEAGKLELYKQPFNIQKLVNNIIHSFAAKAEENATNIVLEIDEQIPSNLIGDQLRLGQILNNLISNAVKFTTQGQITIALTASHIRFDRLLINFSVRDTGIGISADTIEKIFDPFTQEFHANQNEYGGTGLGLAITKRLVELHNSTIDLKSTPGVGTEFTFSISFEKAGVEEQAATQHQANENNVKGMNILLVDDNKMNLLIATKFLNSWQAKVEQALNGQIAVDMANNNSYDLVIMDLQMPVMDGFEAARIIKQNRPGLPIIALSADAMPETSARALKSGMTDYMTKPFVPDVLFAKVAKHYNPIIVN